MKIRSLALCLFFLLFIPLSFLSAQARQIVFFSYTSEPIVVDGFLDEVWDAVNETRIEKPFQNEKPTLEAWWKALYDQQYLYFALFVNDIGNHWPGWMSGGDPFEYDMPVLYLDVNEYLFDGKGVNDVGTGHYEFPVLFAEGCWDQTINVEPNDYCPGGIFACSPEVSEPNAYWLEIAIPFAKLIKQNGDTLSDRINHLLGFDIAIIDQDEGITHAPQRMVWQNDGILGDCRENMDAAGLLESIHSNSPVDRHFFVLPANGDSIAQTTIWTNKFWTAVSDQPWLSVDPDTGYATCTFSLKALPNTADTLRTAFITLYELFVESMTLMVVQEAGVASVHSNIHAHPIRIVPNPVRHSFFVEMPEKTRRIHLYDACGKPVFSKEVHSQEPIDISALPPGLYLAVLETGMKQVKQKLLKTG
ncbi:MAG TPA: sugar-binding protein [Prolixibacteraceae bacterium]|nr:sugar-binding protein [Prolixibacteraceae bacterium]